MAPADDDDALAAEWESALGDGEGGEDSGDGDDLAAEWDSMVSDGDDTEGEGTGRDATRVLNQDEIDSLLGSDKIGDDGGESTGI